MLYTQREEAFRLDFGPVLRASNTKRLHVVKCLHYCHFNGDLKSDAANLCIVSYH